MMDFDPIVSNANPKYKLLRGVMQEATIRRETGYFIVEGPAFVAQAIAHRPEWIVAVVTDDGGAPSVEIPGGMVHWVLSRGLYRDISRLAHADAVMVLVRRPASLAISDIGAFQLGVLLDHIQSPANVGAIIRNAVAFGADFVATLPGTCDPFHPEAIRAMAGNWYQIPLVAITPDQVDQWGKSVQWMMLDASASRELHDMTPNWPLILVVGSEGNGIVTPELCRLKNSNTGVRIPMRDGIESLNAAVSSGIVLHYLNANKGD
jgi:TrmH family RNA methyltransferase